MVKLIIFDFDGVVITGSNEGYFRCYHKALESVGFHLDPKEERKRILDHWGTGYKTQLKYLLLEQQNLLASAIKSYEHYYFNTDLFIRDVKLVKGARQTLEALSKKIQLAIATGMRKKSLDRFLNKFDLKMFRITLSIDDVKKDEDKKPSPFILNEIIRKLKVNPDQTVYVGDGKTDVIMARNARIRPIVVLTGHLTRKGAEQLGVKDIIPDVTHLEEVL